MVPAAIFSIIVGYLDCYSTGWVLVCLIFAEAFTAGTNASLYVSFLDLAPRSGNEYDVIVQSALVDDQYVGTRTNF